MDDGTNANNRESFSVDINISKALDNLQELVQRMDAVEKGLKELSQVPVNISIDVDSKEGQAELEKFADRIEKSFASAEAAVKKEYKKIGNAAVAGIKESTSALDDIGKNLGKTLETGINAGIDRSLTSLSSRLNKALDPKSKHTLQAQFNKLFNVNVTRLEESVSEVTDSLIDKLGSSRKISAPIKELSSNINTLAANFEKLSNAIGKFVRSSAGLTNSNASRLMGLSAIASSLSGGTNLGGSAAGAAVNNYTNLNSLVPFERMNSRQQNSLINNLLRDAEAASKYRERVSEAFASTQKKEGKLLDAQTKRENAYAEYISKQNDRDEILNRRQLEEFEIRERKREETEKRQELRRRQFVENVYEAESNFLARPETAVKSVTKLYDKYNRAVARILGISQRFTQEGRTTGPYAIYSAMAELDTSVRAYNRARLSEMFGMDEFEAQTRRVVSNLGNMGTNLQRISSATSTVVSMFNTLRGISSSLTRMLSIAGFTIVPGLIYGTQRFASTALSSYSTLETAMIGFENFFGDNASSLMSQIKVAAIEAPGLEAADLAEEVRQIAPLADGNQNLALQATLGMLKTIQYGGGQNSEMTYLIKNIRDVMAKGKATQIDLAQFNRAMPAFVKALESIGRDDMVKNGQLYITPENAGELLRVFAQLNTDENSIVRDIFEKSSRTLSGQMQKIGEQFITDWNTMLENAGVYDLTKDFLSYINDGAYLTHFLSDLQGPLSNLINLIRNNQFVIRNGVDELADIIGIIANGIRDALTSIREAFGGVDMMGIIKEGANYLADFFRGLGEGTAQFIKLVNQLMGALRSLGVENIFQVLGWGASLMGSAVSMISGLVRDIIGLSSRITLSSQQTYSLYRSNQLEQLRRQYSAIPESAFAAMPTSAGGITSTSDSARFMLNGIEGTTTAIQEQTQILGAKLDSVNASVRQGTLADTTLAANDLYQIPSYTKLIGANTPLATTDFSLGPFTDWARNRYGQRMVYSADANGKGRAELLVFNPATGVYDPTPLLSSSGKELSGAARTAKAQKEFVKQATIVNKVNRIYGKLSNTLTNVMTGFGKLAMVQGISATLVSLVSSLNVFGDATDTATGLLSSAATTISFAVFGAQVGGVKGGIIGALAGLAASAISFMNDLEEERDKLFNDEVSDQIDEGRQSIYDDAVAFIENSDIPHNFTSTAGQAALNDMLEYIRTAPLDSLSSKDVIQAYSNALAFNRIQEALTDYVTGQDGRGYDQIGGSLIDLAGDRNIDNRLGDLIDLINDFQLLDQTMGYSYDNATNRYVDANNNPIAGQELLEAAFPNGITDQQYEAIMREYASLQEQTQREIGDVTNTTLAESNSYLSSIDKNIADIRNKVMSGDLDASNATEMYGDEAGSAIGKYNSLNTWGARFWNNFSTIDTGFFSDILKTLGYDEDNLPNSTSFNEHQIFGMAGPLMEAGIWGDVGEEPIKAQRIYDKLYQWRDEALEQGNQDESLFFSKWIDILNEQADSVNSLEKLWALYYAMLIDAEDKIGKSLHFASGGFVPKPKYAASNTDSVPAMLTPGEYVISASSARKLGIGVLGALNSGDLTPLIREVAGRLTGSWVNSYATSNTQNNNVRQSNTTINNFHIRNTSPSGGLNTYYALANRLG